MNERRTPDTAAQLTALAAWIDDQLADESCDRQYVAESAASQVRGITLQMLGAAELARQAAPGPFETRDQVRALPAVRASYDAAHISSSRAVLGDGSRRILDEACAAAGVEVGAYDHRVVGWLAGWEPEICAVIAGLITRAATGRGGVR
jgi:hypothetical protein